MHRVDLARSAEAVLASMPDDVHEEMLALIDAVASDRSAGGGATAAVDAVLRGRCWIVYMAMGGLVVVLEAGDVG